MIFYHLSALVLICIVLGLAAVRRCSLYSPLVINASIWLIVFVAGLFFEDRFYPIQEKAFIAWLIWFMVTSLMFFLLCPSRVKNNWIENEIRKIPIDYSLLLLVLIVWLGYRIWVVGSSGPEHFFLNLRLSSMNLEGIPSLGLILRFYPLVFTLFLFEEVYACRENRHLRFLLWCFMILYAVAMMGKSSILTPFVSWAIIQGVKGRLKAKMIVILALVVFSSMISLHVIRSSTSYVFSTVDILAIYIYSPLVALGYMNIDSSLPVGAYVFRFFYVIGNILNIASHPVSTNTPYVAVPELTNVYTVMQPFYHDFGMLGVLLEAVIYGLFFSILYFLSVKRGGFWLILFSGYSIVLVMQFFADLLIFRLSLNLQLLLYALIIFWTSRKVRYVR